MGGGRGGGDEEKGQIFFSPAVHVSLEFAVAVVVVLLTVRHSQVKLDICFRNTKKGGGGGGGGLHETITAKKPRVITIYICQT